MNFLERMGKERLIFDGAMGTMLQDRGLAPGELPDLWNLRRRDAVLDVHRAYVAAGCHIIKTNTFGANRLKLADGGGHSVEETVTAGVALAKEAAGDTAYAALDIGPIGKLLAPFGDLDFEEAVSVFAEMVRAGAKAGADLILIETMSDTYEIKAAMLAARENSSLPVLVTVTLDEKGRLLTGGDIPAAVCLMDALGADALGLNCGLGPEQMNALLPVLARYASVPVIVNPNAGIPEQKNGKTKFSQTPETFAAHMKEIAARAHLMGGCCGTTPAHIAAMAAACGGIPLTPVTPKNHTAVSSYGKAVFFGGETVMIGERINPTGKPRMKKALRENDMDYLCREGLAQIAQGAQILDVNAGLPDIDEAAMLAKAVAALQSVTDTPLQIDTATPAVMERSLRLYNGKPLLNSVSGKEESLETVLPLAKKYGAAVVALTLDDAGIPETVDGRVQIAKKIVSRAARYGISPKDIVVDPLTMTVSTGGDNARITLDALARIRDGLGLHTVLGVSNVSFGLPERKRINAAFFTLAMDRGLSAGIVNPMNTAMTGAFYAYHALSGADEHCAGYIARFSGAGRDSSSEAPKAEEAPSLYEAVVQGLRDQAGKAAAGMAGSMPALEIIDGHLIPALNRVGEDFERGVTFLPQLLTSAAAAQSAFEAVKLYLSAQGREREKRGKIVLATVRGDVHDIGKNIVKTLLENYNFEVIDLGKNVEPSVVVDAVVRENARLAGLSALMTTTVAYMEETIRLLREKAPDCRVMVGGAVLTREYADQIGADFYSKDAMGGVRYAETLFSRPNT